MKLLVLGETIDLTGMDSAAKVDELNKTFASLFEQNEIVQEVIVDGLTLRESYDVYLTHQIDTIRQVEIVTVRGEALAEQVRAELAEYLPRVTRAIDSISDLFYGEMTPDHWQYFSQLIEGMTHVQQSVQLLEEQYKRSDSNRVLTDRLSQFSSRFQPLLLELHDMVEKQDFTAAGDLIKYEMGEAFLQLEQAMTAKVVS